MPSTHRKILIFFYRVGIILCVLLLFRNNSKTLNVFTRKGWPPTLSFKIQSTTDCFSETLCLFFYFSYLCLRSICQARSSTTSCWWQVFSAGFDFLLCTVTDTAPSPHHYLDWQQWRKRSVELNKIFEKKYTQVWMLEKAKKQQNIPDLWGAVKGIVQVCISTYII